MKDEMFDELLESVREGGAILRGEVAPSRSFMMDQTDLNSFDNAGMLSIGEKPSKETENVYIKR